MELRAKSLVASSLIFLSLLLPLRLPEFFWPILGATCLVAALLTFWIFKEKPNLKRLKEDWFTIVFLVVFILSSTIFAYLIPNPLVQASLLGSTVFFIYFIYIVASRLKRNYNPSLFLRNAISLASVLSIFYSIAVILRFILTVDQKSAQLIIIALVMLAVFVISEYLFEVQGFEKSLLYSLTLSFSIMQIVWISSYWLVSYPPGTASSLAGVPLPAILGSLFFYLFWGISHHRLEGTLTRKIIIEYVLISFIFTTVIFLTTKWLP